MDEDQIQEVTPEYVKDCVRAALGDVPRQFRACAFFDEPLDCIRVIDQDCSMTELRVSPRLTIFENTYARPTDGPERYVGFSIKGVRHFCQQNGIPLEAPVSWGELLDGIAEREPDIVRFLVETYAKPLILLKQIPPVRLQAAA